MEDDKSNQYQEWFADAVINKRRFQRYNMDVPVRIWGKDPYGNLLEDITYAFNISAGGANLITAIDYDISHPISIEVHVVRPLGQDIPNGNWTTKARIVRVENPIRMSSGKLKEQFIALSFEKLLGDSSSFGKA